MPVDAPLGTIADALACAEQSSVSIVGFPRESSICLAVIDVSFVNVVHLAAHKQHIILISN
jgi:hypothetical protein